ncbi:hypothetical protein NDU88_000097 [Pleurodeles waltl]|uniref:Uncharacterized protein n=1 Tax=Pleurodeles waltl TaxID=8319 RepID=A0AAV7V6T1_PLEWA|nr:hypothetical protein NDU88_000097 [Pleurodeles waltl]
MSPNFSMQLHTRAGKGDPVDMQPVYNAPAVSVSHPPAAAAWPAKESRGPLDGSVFRQQKAGFITISVYQRQTSDVLWRLCNTGVKAPSNHRAKQD